MITAKRVPKQLCTEGRCLNIPCIATNFRGQKYCESIENCTNVNVRDKSFLISEC